MIQPRLKTGAKARPRGQGRPSANSRGRARGTAARSPDKESKGAPATRTSTPLARLLEGQPPRERVTPLDVFALARSKWLSGERLDIGRIAEELGVSRATVFRWVGSRELLYGEVISALFATAMQRAMRDAHGTGADYVSDVVRRLLQFLVAAAPLRAFVEHDAAYAIRVLMSKDSSVERRCTDIVKSLLEEYRKSGHFEPAMDLDSLAYVIIRISEAFLYRDVITGDPPDVDKAITAIRILLTAAP
jgi:AcrR family transcriptional regulator